MSDAFVTTLGLDETTDPELRLFVDRVTDLLKLEVLHSLTAKAVPQLNGLQAPRLTVGGRQRKQYDSVGLVVDKWVAKKNPQKLAALHAQLAHDTVLPPGLKVFSRSIGFDVRSNRYGLDQVALSTHFAFLNQAFATKMIRSVENRIEFPRASAVASGAVVNKGLKLFCERVTCVDETDPEWAGSDKIAMGGVAVDDGDQTTEIAAFEVGSFSDGAVESYNPHRLLKHFKISAAPYPKSFLVFIGISEKDSGGFSAFLSNLYEAVKAEVQVILTALGAAAGAAFGAATGGAVGTVIGGPIGTIIGVASGLILGALVGWLSSTLKDDIFEPQLTSVTLDSPEADFGGALHSARHNLTYRGFGGQYRARIYWRLER